MAASKQTTTKKFEPYPKVSGGWFAAPHLFRTLLRKKKISDGALQLTILLEIMAETVGRQGSPQWAMGMTAKKFATAAGMTTTAAEVALADLTERGLIAREKEGRSWKYRVTPENWEKAPKYVPKTVEDDDEDEDEDFLDLAPPEIEQDDIDDDVPDAPIAPPVLRDGRTLVVKPGLAARPITLAQAVAKVHFTSSSPKNVRFEYGIIEGALHFNFLGVGEEKANHTPTPVWVSSNPSDDSKVVSRPKSGVFAKAASAAGGRPGTAGDTPTPVGVSGHAFVDSEVVSRPKSAQIADELLSFLTERVVPVLSSLPDAKVLAQIRTNLNGTPLPFFASRLNKRLKAVQSYGFVAQLAKDASEAYHAVHAQKDGAFEEFRRLVSAGTHPQDAAIQLGIPDTQAFDWYQNRIVGASA